MKDNDEADLCVVNQVYVFFLAFPRMFRVWHSLGYPLNEVLLVRKGELVPLRPNPSSRHSRLNLSFEG